MNTTSVPNQRRSWPAISYVVVLGTDGQSEGHTPLQGFSFGLLDKLPVIRHLLTLPASVHELGMSRDNVICSRSLGLAPYRIVPVTLRSLDALATWFSRFPFTCLISDEQSVASIQAFVTTQVHEVLHVTTAPTSEVLALSALDRETLLKHHQRIAAAIVAAGGVVNMPELPTAPPIWPSKSLRVVGADHSVSLVNQAVLESLGVTVDRIPIALPLEEPRPSSLEEADRPYVQAILGGATAVRDVRDATRAHNKRDPTIDLILAAPAMVHRGQRPALTEAAEHVVAQLARQTNYPTFWLPPADLRRFLESPEAQTITHLRTGELLAFATVVAVKGAGHCAPTLLLPPGVNRAGSRLRALATCANGRSPNKARKLSRIARDVGAEMGAAIPTELMAMIRAARGGYKFISDAPLELLPVDGLPLSLRAECSRICATPGNLLARELLAAEVVPYEVSAFNRVLILRSYAPDDPIQGMLQSGVEEWLAQAQHPLHVTWRDVASHADVVAALNAFDGEIVVIDSHGQHRDLAAHGSLLLGPTPLNVWELRQTRIPRIVVLSACETHAVGASHATVANGFLAAGATTVLATLTAVDAAHSAFLVGRLLYHLADLIPLIGEQRVAVRWSTIMLGVLQRMYVFDVTRTLWMGGHINLSEDQFNAMQTFVNSLLSTGDPDWFWKTLEELARATGNTPARIRHLHADYAYFTDTLQYVQLGSPEDLLILGTFE